MSRRELSASSAPAPLPSDATLNCLLISVIKVFHALTKLLMAVVAWEVSGLTLTATLVFGEADPRFSVTPLITLLTVLLALLIGMPSTTREALVPVTALVKLSPVPVLLETVRSPGAPELLLTNASR